MTGLRIKELREMADMSQDELAKAIGVAQSSIGNYERGWRSPDADTLIKLSKHFGVTVDFILGLSEYDTYEDEKSYREAVTSAPSESIYPDGWVELIQEILRFEKGLKSYYSDEQNDIETLARVMVYMYGDVSRVVLAYNKIVETAKADLPKRDKVHRALSDATPYYMSDAIELLSKEGDAP